MNIANIHDCYGCGVCAAACPRRIISMRLNGDGFYEPHIADESRCTGCGREVMLPRAKIEKNIKKVQKPGAAE